MTLLQKKKQTNKQTNKQKKRIGKLKQTIAVKKEKTLPTAVVKDNTAEEEEEATGENDTSANGPVCSFCEKQTEEDVVACGILDVDDDPCPNVVHVGCLQSKFKKYKIKDEEHRVMIQPDHKENNPCSPCLDEFYHLKCLVVLILHFMFVCIWFVGFFNTLVFVKL